MKISKTLTMRTLEMVDLVNALIVAVRRVTVSDFFSAHIAQKIVHFDLAFLSRWFLRILMSKPQSFIKR